MKLGSLAALVFVVASVALLFVPSPMRLADDGGESLLARVVAVDDSDLRLAGVVEYGTQHLTVEMLAGPASGRRFPAANEMRAQLDLDKKFAVGDVATVVWPANGVRPGETLVARDHYRLGWGAALFAGFVLLLVVFGGWTGLKAILSFVFSCLAVWKLLVPLCLDGQSASLVSLATVLVLTAVIMFLVAGVTLKGASAFFGAMLGVGASLAMAGFFARVMHVNGATMPYVQSLLNSGYENLDIADVFVGAIILASSGAVMDLAIDVASAVEEVARHNPRLGFGPLFRSGLRVGRSVVGTMTTTLLLAYSGGYLTLLMVFAAQGTRPLDFLNSTLVSAELVKTLVGSFGLVLVAPFTAVVSAGAFARRWRQPSTAIDDDRGLSVPIDKTRQGAHE